MKKLPIVLSFIMILCLSGIALAQDPLTEGIALLGRKDYTGALPLLQKAVRMDPKSEKANLNLGEVYFHLEEFDSAGFYFRKTINIEKESAAAYYGLGEVCVKQKKYPEAIANLVSATNYDGKNIKYVIALGEAYIAVDSLDNATAAFYKARDMNDKNPEVLAGIGDVYAKQGIYDPAIQSYKDALELDSTDVEVRLKLAEAYMKTGNGAGAYEQFLKVSQLAPNNPDGQHQAGELLYANKHYKDAVPFLAKYHQLVPTDYRALHELIESALDGGLYDDAAKYATEYLQKFPNSLEAKKELGAAYYLGKKPVDSYSIFKTVPTDSMDAVDLVRFGLAATSAGDTNAAIQAWTHAVTRDTSLYVIDDQLAGILFATRNYDQAIVYFNKYLAAKPDDIGAALNMGLCYIAKQDYPDAIATLRKVVTEKSDSYLGWRWLALAYAASDSLPQATDSYHHLVDLAQSDSSGTDHSSEMNEAYRYFALGKIISGSKLQKDKPEEAKKFYEDAYQDLLSALKYDKNDVKTHALLAQDYAFLGKIDEACKEIKSVLRSNPKDSQMLKLQKALSCQ